MATLYNWKAQRMSAAQKGRTMGYEKRGWRTRITAALVGALVVTATAATAAGLTVATTAIMSGEAAVIDCDQTGVDLSMKRPQWDASQGTPVSSTVRVKRLDGPCTGMDVTVYVIDANGNEIGYGESVFDGSNNFEVALAAPVAIRDVGRLAIAVTGN